MEFSALFCLFQKHGSMARGDHGLPKVSPKPSCPTFLRPAGGPPLKQHYVCFRGGRPTRRATCGYLLPPLTPHAVRLCSKLVCLPRLILGDGDEPFFDQPTFVVQVMFQARDPVSGKVKGQRIRFHHESQKVKVWRLKVKSPL
jgi:hypothetical protein